LFRPGYRHPFRRRRRLGSGVEVVLSHDATGERDFVASFLHAAALCMVHLRRMCEDLILFTSEEIAFLDLADETATGSSLMPQKKNPDPLELVRGKSGRVIGRLTGWLATMKSLPIGYSKDLQEDKEALFESEDTLRGSLDAVASVVRGLTFRGNVSERAASGLLLATDGSVVGILAERDVVRAAYDKPTALDSLRVQDVMRPAPTCDADDTIRDAMHRMTAERQRHFLVLDEGKLVGVLSVGDLVNDRLRQLEAEADVLRDYVAAHRAVN
jgi:CBS domain-containing protein